MRGTAHSHCYETQTQVPQAPLAFYHNWGFQKMREGSLSRVSFLVSDCISSKLSTMMPSLQKSCMHADTHKHTHQQPDKAKEIGVAYIFFFNEISQPLSIAFTGLWKSRIYTIHTMHTTHTSKNRFLARDSMAFPSAVSQFCQPGEVKACLGPGIALFRVTP